MVVCKNKASLLGCEDLTQLPVRRLWRCCHQQSCAVGRRLGEQWVFGVAAAPRAPSGCASLPGKPRAGLLEAAVSKQLGAGCWPWYLTVAGASKTQRRLSKASSVLRMMAGTDLRCLKLPHRVCCWASQTLPVAPRGGLGCAGVASSQAGDGVKMDRAGLRLGAPRCPSSAGTTGLSLPAGV